MIAVAPVLFGLAVSLARPAASEFRRVFAAMAQDRVDSLYVAATMENLQYRRLVVTCL